MLQILGMIGANMLSLPGILGLAFGMMTRKWGFAAFGGALIGLLEALLFAKFDFSQIDAVEMVISILIGIIACLVGCAIRRKGVLI